MDNLVVCIHYPIFRANGRAAKVQEERFRDNIEEYGSRHRSSQYILRYQFS